MITVSVFTAAILIALAYRRSWLAKICAASAVAGWIVTSEYLGIGQVWQAIWIAAINLMLSFGCLHEWRYRKTEVSGFILLAVGSLLFFSFSRLIVAGLFVGEAHNGYQIIITNLSNLAISIEVCLLMWLPDKPESLHDMAANIRDRFNWTRNILAPSSNRDSQA